MIARTLTQQIQQHFGGDKAIIVFGARQVGKTTLLKHLYGPSDEVLWLNGDEEETRAAFEHLSAETFATILGNHKVCVIDEAQRIEDIGLKLKIIQDAYRDNMQLIATGSSSFDLANNINEPLTGRKWEYTLYPLSFVELCAHHGLVKESSNLENRLLYGWYPDIVTHAGEARARLVNLVNDNLYKDIYRWENIKRPLKFETLLKGLAFQVGSQVSINELAQLTGLDNKTVLRYLDLLEKSFIIFRLPSFSRNLRSELKISSKFFFTDVGVRNALIGDFRPTALRQDIGGLFENFMIAEMFKTKDPLLTRSWFWRTHQQQEIDYLEEQDGQLAAYEIKWNPRAKVRFSSTFTQAYEPASTTVINRENFSELLLQRVK